MSRKETLLAIVLSTVLPCAAGFGQSPAPSLPALVVVIVVDQMRADYLPRFVDLFGNGGFKRLMNHGAMYTNCMFDYASTFTAPGHSLILSGIPPRISGIIGNEWFDRNAMQTVYCVQDTAERSVGIDPMDPAGRMSPRNFHGRSLGDQLRAVSPTSRVIGLAIKDRGAILPAGQRPTAAYWFDPASGRWITSTYYRDNLPAWAEEFNAAGHPERALGTSWLKLLPDSCYRRAGPDDAPGEGVIPGERSRAFPHVIHDLGDPNSPAARLVPGARRFDALLPTPAGDRLTEDFAEAAIEGEQLGRRGVVDMLSISFSSPDYCGHIFGPDSQEMEDIQVRLDRTLARLFQFIDARVGLANVVVVLTADHGVCPLPERSGNGAMRVNGKDLLMDLKVRMGQQLGYNEGADNLIEALSNSFLYFDGPAIAARGFSYGKFEADVIKAIRAQPGIAGCYTREEIQEPMTGGDPGSGNRMHYARSFNVARSGDLVLLTRKNCFFSGDTTGTTHGTPYEYDRHVPLLLYGFGIRPGRYTTPSRPDDIASTLAGILRIAAPAGADGSVLFEALSQSTSPSSHVERAH